MGDGDPADWLRRSRPSRTVDSAEDRRLREKLRHAVLGEPASPVRIGRFVVLERIGAGGIGEVYAAWDPELERRIAVKVLRTGPAARIGSDDPALLVREAKALAQLSDPHVVTVYEVGRDTDDVFLAMELVDGGDLQGWLDGVRGRRASAPEAVAREAAALLLDAARGLAAAHAAGVVHGDFKPGNVLVGRDGRARVVDFGLARHLRRDDDDAPSGGTPAYMAPEQHRGRPPDAASDVYAFGVALYEALFGERPFAGVPAAELHDAKRQGVAVPTRSIPRAWRELVEACLAVDPAARPVDASEIVRRLAPRPMRDRRRVGIAVAGLGALAIAGWAHAWVPASAPCDGVDAPASEAWSPAVRAGLGAALLATGKPHAELSASRTAIVVDAWIEQWGTQRREACEATARSEQSSALLDARMACLDRALAETASTVGVLQNQADVTIDRALQIVEGLPALDRCADVDRLLRTGGRVVDDATVLPLVEALARGRTQKDAARFEEARATLDGLLVDIRSVGDIALEAETLHELAAIDVAVGEWASAETRIHAALALAERSGQDELRAILWGLLVRVQGEGSAPGEDAERSIAHAEAVLARQPSPQAELHIAFAIGQLRHAQGGRWDEARDAFGRALELAEVLHGPDSVRAANIRSHLGMTLRAAGEIEAALEAQRAALEVSERVLGPSHPTTAYCMQNLGLMMESDLADPQAREYLMRAHDVLMAAYGPRHHLVVSATANLSLFEQGRNELVAALAWADESVELAREVFPPGHPRLGQVLMIGGRAHLVAGDIRVAVTRLEESLAIGEKNSITPVRRGQTMYFLARAVVGTDSERARALASRARALLADSEAPELVPEIDAFLLAGEPL